MNAGDNRKSTLETIERLSVLAAVIGCIIAAAFHPPLRGYAIELTALYTIAMVSLGKR